MGSFQDAAKRKQDLIDAAKARAKKPDALAKVTTREYIKPEDAASRIRLVFDNSGSMMGWKIKNAKEGTVEFLRTCTLDQDAVAVHLLDNPSNSEDEISLNIINSVLMTDLAQLASDVDTDSITAFASTPLFNTIDRALRAKPQLTRMIAFSDGEPDWDDRNLEPTVLKTAKEVGIPIDTVYIGSTGTTGQATMKRIAEATGGIALVFDPAKGVNFAESLKYLAPKKRLLLMDAKFKADLEAGRVR